MTNYRFYLIGFDGYFVGSTFVACSSDEVALAKATEMLRTFYARVEVWDGSRKVGHREASAASYGDNL
jgi:hypothetical protein